MKKILVLFTGGTIGSTTQDGIINVAGDGKFTLISSYRSQFGNEPQFECRQILNILSENILFAHWERLVEIISNIDTDNYQGIIVTHGSDTLAYTSAFLGMYFRHINIPLYIIASNKPINEKGSNGLFNFYGAVEKIREGKYRGVFTLYEKVYLPTRLMPADTYQDRFQAYGEDGYNEFSVFKGISDRMLVKKREQLFYGNIKLDNHIMKIHGYAGIDFSQYSLDSTPSAVLYVPYHSGTACTDTTFGENFSLCEFIKKCILKDIMVYICGIKKTKIMYDTLHEIISTGSIPLYNISDVSAYMKLLIAYNQKEYPVKEVMGMNLYFEHLDTPLT